MECVWRPQAECHEAEAAESEKPGQPTHRDNACDDLRRRHYDADLECRRREFILMIAGQPGVALMLQMFGQGPQLFAAIVFFRI